MDAKQTVLSFIDAINRHHVADILALMTEDHLFIDAYGSQETKTQMETGWPGYFAWFPDYRIDVAHLMEDGDAIGVFGYAGGTYSGAGAGEGQWRIPAAWMAVVRSGKVRIWQVFADSKIPYDIMEGANTSNEGHSLLNQEVH